MVTGGYGKARKKQCTDALRAKTLVEDQIGRSPISNFARAKDAGGKREAA